MKVLERIKKKQLEGFREFVQSMESANPTHRSNMFTLGILEDPIFMSWVVKNMKTFEQCMELSSGELASVLDSQEQMPKVFAKAFKDRTAEEFQKLEKVFARHFSKIRDEFGFITEIAQADIDGARNYILKAARKLQSQGTIDGFPWELPPMEVFYDIPLPKEGVGSIKFLTGTLAASGPMLKGKRNGVWKHFYETGKLFAQGEYLAGLKEGPWQFFYGNGNLKAEGKFKADEKHGAWREIDRAGNALDVQYVEGKRESP